MVLNQILQKVLILILENEQFRQNMIVKKSQRNLQDINLEKNNLEKHLSIRDA